MPVTFLAGDLFSHDELQAFAHGCNCAGAMGKGIALEVRRRFPAMYDEYRRRCRAGTFGLGDVFVWRQDGRTVFNLGTQKTWKTPADLTAVEAAVKEMVRLAEECGIARIGMPRIGAGLGRLDWNAVKETLTRIGASTRVELIVFEEYVP